MIYIMETIELYQFKSILPANISDNDPEGDNPDARPQRDEHEKDEAIEEYIDPGIGKDEEICDPDHEEELEQKKKSSSGSVTHG
jgi:hypothetical protein